MAMNVKVSSTSTVSAVIAAAGSSYRMKGKDKLFSEIQGTPIIILSALAFEQNENIDEIIIVSSAQKIDEIKELAKKHSITKLSQIILGGKTRHESVLNGVKASKGDFVAIHDGARPLISQKVINKTVFAAIEFGAAIPAVNAKDTIKLSHDGENIESTPDRSFLFNAQTPQVFNRNVYLKCVERLGIKAQAVTDDSMIFELCSKKVKLVKGDYKNIKITTPEDLMIAEVFLKSDL